MKIKQTVKTFIFSLAVMTAPLFAVIAGPSVRAECGGVQTSIINCDETGACKDGSNPYEGSKPADSGQDEYKKNHGHFYGQCTDGSSPDASIESSGVWGILIFVINILTVGIGVVAVGGVVYASILYISAGGSTEQTKKALTIIADIVVGVLAYAIMFALLNFLVPGGLFNAAP